MITLLLVLRTNLASVKTRKKCLITPRIMRHLLFRGIEQFCKNLCRKCIFKMRKSKQPFDELQHRILLCPHLQEVTTEKRKSSQTFCTNSSNKLIGPKVRLDCLNRPSRTFQVQPFSYSEPCVQPFQPSLMAV